MKKSLALAMAMALGVTASAYAANPFSDVPAGHWAYDSIEKLAAAGVIEGYGDGTFRGDRLMTRYEMAQIVAKAMAKGANVDRLASEFADELDALGVRVAALEKKSDNVKITGQIRYNYGHTDRDDWGSNATTNRLRSRLFFNGAVNDNWDYVGMLENIQHFNNNSGDETTKFQRAYLKGRLGGLKVTAGRYSAFRADGNLYDTRMDGIDVTYGDKVRLNAYYGRPTDGKGDISALTATDGDYVSFDRAWGAEVAADLGKTATLAVGYDKFMDPDAFDKDGHSYGLTADDEGVFHAGVDFKLGKDAKLGFMYLKADEDYGADVDTDGFVVTLGVGDAGYKKVGAASFEAKYYDQGVGTFIAHTMNGDAASFFTEGFKGYKLGATYTVAKNMRAGIEYYDLKGKESDNKSKTLWGEFQVRF